jgi:hypothetical protein
MKLISNGANRTVLSFTRNGVPHEILFSYSTPVAGRIGTEYFRTDTHYSATTSKHITQYLYDVPSGATIALRSPEHIAALVPE